MQRLRGPNLCGTKDLTVEKTKKINHLYEQNTLHWRSVDRYDLH